jgi:PAS domain S-box-containing protein
MVSLTQNNKIAIAAVLIFLVSFSVMLFSIDKEIASPEYIKSNVLEAGAGEGGSEGGHHVYFSEGENSHGEVAEEASEELNLDEVYKNALEGFDGPIFALLPEGKVKFLNEKFSGDYGYELEDAEEVEGVKGDIFFSFISSSDLPDFAAEYTKVLQSGKAENGTGPYGLLKKDGGTSVVMVSFLPVVNEEGKVLEIIGSIKDITEKVGSFNKVEATTEVKVEESVEE